MGRQDDGFSCRAEYLMTNDALVSAAIARATVSNSCGPRFSAAMMKGYTCVYVSVYVCKCVCE